MLRFRSVGRKGTQEQRILLEQVNAHTHCKKCLAQQNRREFNIHFNIHYFSQRIYTLTYLSFRPQYPSVEVEDECLQEDDAELTLSKVEEEMTVSHTHIHFTLSTVEKMTVKHTCKDNDCESNTHLHFI